MENSDIQKNRLHWVDISKALLLFLVFWGHIETYGDTVSSLIFSFHMPAFFILSGYTFKMKESFREFLWHKIKTLIFPYFFFCIIGGCIHLCYGQYELFGSEMLRQLFITVQPDYLYCGAGWFLIALFLANIYMYLWVKYFEQFDGFFKMVAVSGLFYIAQDILLFNSVMNIERLPFKADTALMACFFMIVGFYLHKKSVIKKVQEHKLFFSMLLLLVFVPAVRLNGWSNMANCAYNQGVFYLMGSISGTLLIIITGLLLEKLRGGVKRALLSIGKVTLPMFMVHGMFLSVMNTHFNIHTGVDVSGIKAVVCAICMCGITYPIGLVYVFFYRKILPGNRPDRKRMERNAIRSEKEKS